ncbi:hypothetical protein ES703_109834 [subsurface metagenome]
MRFSPRYKIARTGVCAWWMVMGRKLLLRISNFRAAPSPTSISVGASTSSPRARTGFAGSGCTTTGISIFHPPPSNLSFTSPLPLRSRFSHDNTGGKSIFSPGLKTLSTALCSTISIASVASIHLTSFRAAFSSSSVPIRWPRTSSPGFLTTFRKFSRLMYSR